MKANAPKRKVFADAMDLLTDTIEQVKGVASIAIDAIVPFHDHPFICMKVNVYRTWWRASRFTVSLIR